jgi:hypothetical protein
MVGNGASPESCAAVKSIWGIFVFVQMRTKVVR